MVAELRAPRPWQAMAQAVQQRETVLPEGGVATRKVELTVKAPAFRLGRLLRQECVEEVYQLRTHLQLTALVDLRPFASGSQAPAAPQAGQAQYFHMGTPPQSSTLPTLPQKNRLLFFQTPEHLFPSHMPFSTLNFLLGQKKDICLFSDRHLWPGKRLLYLQNFAFCVLP